MGGKDVIGCIEDIDAFLTRMETASTSETKVVNAWQEVMKVIWQQISTKPTIAATQVFEKIKQQEICQEEALRLLEIQIANLDRDVSEVKSVERHIACMGRVLGFMERMKELSSVQDEFNEIKKLLLKLKAEIESRRVHLVQQNLKLLEGA